jgi:hypothetical protein
MTKKAVRLVPMADDDIDTADFDAERWHTIAETCFSKRPLYVRERAFTEDMVAMTLRGYRPTTAQANWLMRIFHRREVGDENSDL